VRWRLAAVGLLPAAYFKVRMSTWPPAESRQPPAPLQFAKHYS